MWENVSGKLVPMMGDLLVLTGQFIEIRKTSLGKGREGESVD